MSDINNTNMKRKSGRRLLTLLLIAVLVVGCGIRIAYVNLNAPRSIRQEYPLGEKVVIGDNYVFNEDINRSDYAIQIVDCWIETLDEFLARHSLSLEDVGEDMQKFSPNFIMVKMNLFNTSDQPVEYSDGYAHDGSGINMFDLQLTGPNYMLTVNTRAFAIEYNSVHPSLNGALTFALLPGDDPFEVTVPFPIGGWQETVEDVRANPPMLQISAYPEMKLLHIIDGPSIP